MTDAIYTDGLAVNLIALRHTLASAMVDATTACKDLEDNMARAAVGAVIPIGQALSDARALLDAILILQRQNNYADKASGPASPMKPRKVL